jgi:ADP-ribose pyrophosphatase YjhB (NUDIX family)
MEFTSSLSSIPNLIIASGPLIIEDDQVWLNRKQESDIWQIPGGKLEEVDIAGDTKILERTCVREAKEENGFAIEIIAPLQTLLVKRPDKEDSWAVLVHFLAKRIDQQEPQPGEEIAEVRSVPVTQIISGDHELRLAPNVVPIVTSYLDLKSRGLFS